MREETEIVNIVNKYSIRKEYSSELGFSIQKGTALSRIWSTAAISLKLANELFAKESAGQ